MDSIEPPSFSLGFDLEPASDPHPVPGDDGEPDPGLTVLDSDMKLDPGDGGEPEPGLTVSDSDIELDPVFSSPVLKRLRQRMSMNKPSSKVDTNDLLGCKEDEDVDDIEEFSSPEDGPSSTRSHFSSCSSRVPSLHGSGVISKQTSISRNQEKRKRLDVPSSAAASGITSFASSFQRSAARSPLRRFQLLDSDSEDDHPSKRRDYNEVTKRNDSSSKDQPCGASIPNRKESGSLVRTGDLLKDFPPATTSKSQTPAQRRFQLLDSDSEDDLPSSSRDLRGVTKTNDSSSKCQPFIASKPKRKESGDLCKEFSPATISKSQTPALQRFQLIDSDSEEDHPSSIRDLSGVTKTNSSCLRDQPSVASKQKRKEPGSMPSNVDLWKDFSPVAASKIQTPTLDDVCQDYFSSIRTISTSHKQRSTVASSCNSGLFQQTGEFFDSSHPSPPSHRFFLHNNLRIQNLARQRLPNFLPLGIVNDRERGREVCLIDYMNQFSGKESYKTGEANTKGKTKPKGSKKRSLSPKDAGKIRVSANNGTAGHWFTCPEGRKVYISKSGQEFSGQSAYRCYKKETGSGFNKSKKKRQPKKKAKK